jgi:hypothetical protein
MLEAAATNVLADVLTRKARYVAALASRSPSDAVDSLYLLGDNSFRPVQSRRAAKYVTSRTDLDVLWRTPAKLFLVFARKYPAFGAGRDEQEPSLCVASAWRVQPICRTQMRYSGALAVVSGHPLGPALGIPPTRRGDVRASSSGDGWDEDIGRPFGSAGRRSTASRTAQRDFPNQKVSTKAGNSNPLPDEHLQHEFALVPGHHGRN